MASSMPLISPVSDYVEPRGKKIADPNENDNNIEHTQHQHQQPALVFQAGPTVSTEKPLCSSTNLYTTTKPSDWKVQMIESAIRDIERAEFVALDLEFSGLFRAQSRQHHLDKYFKECVESARDFMAVQLGVCPVWRASADAQYLDRLNRKDDSSSSNGQDVWIMAPYNFHIFPADRKIFSADTLTLAWLLENGFSFQDWIRNGFDFMRLAVLQTAEKTKQHSWRRNLERVKEEGVQRVVQSIIENLKPVVVHNGLFDMLHIHHKFIDEPADNVGDFCREWLRIFKAGTFDTKHIANEGLHTVLQIGRGTALNDLYHTLHQRKCQSHFLLAPRYFMAKIKNSHDADQCSDSSEPKNLPGGAAANQQRTSSMTGGYSLMPLPIGHAEAKCHEAGYDAMLTAQIFLMELELFHRQYNEQQSVKSTLATKSGPHLETDNNKNNNKPRNGSKSSFSKNSPYIPFNWRSSVCFGQPFADSIELVKIAPGKIDLKGIAAYNNLQPKSRWMTRSVSTGETGTTGIRPVAHLIAKEARLNTQYNTSRSVDVTRKVEQKFDSKSVQEVTSPLKPLSNDSASLDGEWVNDIRPNKRRRTEETSTIEDDEISSDGRTSRRKFSLNQNCWSDGELADNDDREGFRDAKEELLMRRVQRLRETRRAKLLEDNSKGMLSKSDDQLASCNDLSEDEVSEISGLSPESRRIIKRNLRQLPDLPDQLYKSDPRSPVMVSTTHRSSHRPPTSTWAIPFLHQSNSSCNSHPVNTKQPVAPDGSCSLAFGYHGLLDRSTASGFSEPNLIRHPSNKIPTTSDEIPHDDA